MKHVSSSVARGHRWKTFEEAILREHYPLGGSAACLELMPHRSMASIHHRAYDLGIKGPRIGRGNFNTKYDSSEHIDNAIRDFYAEPPRKRFGAMKRLSVAVMRPEWWIRKRALALGLTRARFREDEWSEEELEILKGLSTKTSSWIQRALKRAGYKRSEGAIVQKRIRLGLERKDPDYFSQGDMCLLFGVSYHTLQYWERSCGLRPGRHGMSIALLKAWIKDHAQLIDLRKVDRFMFIDLMCCVVNQKRHEEGNDDAQDRPNADRSSRRRAGGDGVCAEVAGARVRA